MAANAAFGELIGRGGMGEVYMATHAALRRPAAVKLIGPDDADKEAVARFEREVQLASELTHANTVRIYDYGCSEDGVFYCAMEYLPGVNLEDLVAREGPLPVARVIHVLRQVCRSLGEAHGKGLVHRDVKPGNIMLCERGGSYDYVKVLDFGLARRISAGDGTQLTATGKLSGTPLHIAPERVRNSSELDPRSDIYSLATVGFCLLTGEHVFDGDSPMDVLDHVLNGEPRRPSEVAEQAIPSGLDDLILQCLAKEPGSRPAGVSEMVDTLDALAAEFPWQPQDAERAWQDYERSPGPSVAGTDDAEQ